jgi:hypothetical protein
LRNSIVHGNGLSEVEVDVDQSRRSMVFLHEAAMTAVRSLASAYRLPVEWNVLLGGGTKEEK